MQMFHGHYTGQRVFDRILLEQSFTARMPLLMATTAFRLGRRQRSLAVLPPLSPYHKN